MYNNTQLTYQTYETESHGYRMTHVVIREMYREDTEKHLEGTVDNKAGYGTPEAAVLMGRRYQAMLDAGHPVHFDCTTSGLNIHLRWQHFEKDADGTQQYCDVAYEDLGRSLGQIKEAMKFLQKIGRSIEKIKAARRNEKATFKSDPRDVSNHTFDRPEDVMLALGRMRKTAQVRYDRALEATVLTDTELVGAGKAA